MKTVRVNKSYSAEFPNPIEMKKGDKIRVLKRNEGDYKRWFWCRTDNGVEAYVPENALDVKETIGTFVTDYTSLELDAEEGESMSILHRFDGWAFCVNDKVEKGWLPLENLTV